MKIIIGIIAILLVLAAAIVVATNTKEEVKTVLSTEADNAAHIAAIKEIKSEFETATSPEGQRAAKNKYERARDEFRAEMQMALPVYNRTIGRRVWLEGAELEAPQKEDDSVAINKKPEQIIKDRNRKYKQNRYELGLD